MAIFGNKKKQEPSPEELEAQRQAEALRQAWEKLDHHINNNPLFAVTTFDGLNWLEPFSGQVVATPFGRVTEARKYYAANDHWRNGRTKTVNELHSIRWQHWIQENIRSDDRLRIFNAQGQWLCPASGEWARQVAREEGKVTPTVLKGMADHLVAKQAQSPSAFKTIKELKSLVGATNEESALANPVITGDGFSTSSIDIDSDEPSPVLNKIKRKRTDSQYKQDSSIDDLRRLLEQQKAANDIGSQELPSQDVHTSQDLDRARKVQEKMLGKIPEIPGFEIAVHYKPYDAIGGDFYEICTLPDGRILILLGDVTGHGVQAALVTSSMIKSLRFITRVESDLVEILAQLNDNAREDLISGQFVTVWAGILDTNTKIIETVCAGHHPAFLGNPEKDVVLEKIGSKGAALGLMSSTIIRKQFTPTHYQLEPGDIIFQYTDGVSEMQHPERGEFGDFRTMGGVVGHLDAENLEDLNAGVMELASQFTGLPPDDDVTMVTIRFSDSDGAEEASA